MSRECIVVRFEGSAGDGILSMGKIVAKIAAQAGYNVSTHSSFLAQVRGGQSGFQLKAGRGSVRSPGGTPDIVLALNQEAFENQCGQTQEEGLVLHGPMAGEVPRVRPRVQLLALDFDRAAESSGAGARSKNIVAVGALVGVLGLDPNVGQEVVRAQFGQKKPEVIAANLRAFAAGLELGSAEQRVVEAFRLAPAQAERRWLMSGNEAVALGALAAGVRFYAGYPITPASEVMEVLANYLPRAGGRFIQAEDEIAALGMCIGASFGGVSSLTATSGPGLSLMVELIGLAGMAEVPVVIIDVQRAGPSTGMPTQDGQGDLNLAVHGTHGEVPRVVLAPQTVEDCFHQTIEAVAIAHEFHLPVIVLSSQSLSHALESVSQLTAHRVFQERVYQGQSDGPFLRFPKTEDGTAPMRSIPGTPGGAYQTGGLEHDETGHPSFEPKVREEMVARRRERMRAVERVLSVRNKPHSRLVGGSLVGVLSWGRTATIALEALEGMRETGQDVSYLLPHVLWPLPDEPVRRFLYSGVKTVFVCEANATRQLAELVRARYAEDLMWLGIRVVSITKDDGTPFTLEDLRGRIAAGIRAANDERQNPLLAGKEAGASA